MGLSVTSAEQSALVSFADRLIEAREQARRSQADVARACGMSRGLYAHLESARTVPTYIHLMRLARALEMTFEIDG